MITIEETKTTPGPSSESKPEPKAHVHKTHSAHKHATHTHKANDTEETYTIDKVTFWQGISLFLFIFLLLSIFIPGFGIDGKMADGNSIGNTAPAAGNNGAAAPSPSLDMEALMDDDPVKGDADAPITIVEFSDFECPFCARFYSDTYQKIIAEYVDTGKVKIVYRDFPLSFHPNAQKAAEAAECAEDQGEFWAMHDILFEQGVVGGPTTFKGYAATLGLDANDFADCLDSGKHAAEVRADLNDGAAAGVTGTPGFYINGVQVVGAQPFSVFEQIIEAELAKQ
ncbi:MAG: protein-disulfide isomerase [Candidatus Woesearchaeota archaeon]